MLVKRIAALALSACLAGMAMAGCSNTYTQDDSPAASAPAQSSADRENGSEPDGTADNGGAKPLEITYAVGQDTITLDASKITDSRSGEIIYYINAGLLRNYKDQVQYDIAESYDVSEDGLVYTFHLRDSVWSDGEPLTAEHFRYSYERMLDPATGASMADDYYYIKNAEAFNTGEITDPAEIGVKAIDEKTLEITLEYPHPYFITLLSTTTNTVPLRQEIVEQYGEDYGADKDKLCMNGPYTIASLQPDAETVLVKNPNYWDADSITVDKITRLVVADGNTRISMFDNGEIDGTTEVPTTAEGNYPDAEIHVSGALRSLQLNVAGMTPETAPVMGNLNFHKALSYALDRQAVTTATGGAGSIPTNRVTLMTLPGTGTQPYVEEFPIEGLVPLNGDREKAVEYLELALEELGMTRETMPTLTVMTFESANFKLMAEAYIDTWSQVLGLEHIELQQYPVPTAIQNCAAREYDIYLQSFSSDPDPVGFLNNWTSNGGINWTGYADEEFDAMVASTWNMSDPGERLAALRDAEAHLLEYGPHIPVFYVGGIHLVREGLEGFHYGNISNAEQWLYCTEQE